MTGGRSFRTTVVRCGVRVRCPQCKSVHDDPPGRFRCSGCSRLLAWHVPAGWPEQLSLFRLPGDPMTLLFVSNTVSPPARRDDDSATGERAGATADSPGMTAAQGHLLKQSIALVTAMLPGDGGDDLVPAVLADQSPEELLGLAATTGWLMSALIREFEEIAPGAAEAWLQGMAIELAKQAHSPEQQPDPLGQDRPVGASQTPSGMSPGYSSGRDRALHHLCLAGHAADVAGDVDSPSGRFWLLHVHESHLQRIAVVLLEDNVPGLGNRQALVGHYVIVQTRHGVWVHEHCDGDQKPAEARAAVRFSVMQREAQA